MHNKNELQLFHNNITYLFHWALKQAILSFLIVSYENE